MTTSPPIHLRPELRILSENITPDGTSRYLLYDPVRHHYFYIGEEEKNFFDLYWLGEQAELAKLAQNNPQWWEKWFLFIQHYQWIQATTEPQCCRLPASPPQNNKVWWQILLAWFFYLRLPILQPDRMLAKFFPWSNLFFKNYFYWGLLGVLLVAIHLLMRRFDQFWHTFPYFFSPTGALWLFLSLIVAKSIHELGHAIAARHLGLPVRGMGIVFMLGIPVLYTDTTDAWQLTSGQQRLKIALAGMVAESILAVLALFLWSFTPEGILKGIAFTMATVTWSASLIINMNPLMRFDGYYWLSDLTNLPNLQARAFAMGRWWLREWLFGWQDSPPEYLSSPSKRLVLISYALASWIWRLVLFSGIALFMYHFYFKILGLLLIALEVWLLLLAPLNKEIRLWWRLRSRIHWNTSLLRTLLILTSLLFIFFLPLSTHIELPAILRGMEEHLVYPPYAASIRSIQVQRGQQVTASTVVAILDSPVTQFKHQQTLYRVQALNHRLTSMVSWDAGLKNRSVVEQELAQTMAQAQSWQARQEQLHLKSPITGQVVELDERLVPGMWLEPKTSIMRIVSTHRPTIEAMGREIDLARLSPHLLATFYPENLDLSPCEVRLDKISDSHAERLDSPYFASHLGGVIPVRVDSHHHWIPHETVYRLWFTPLACSSVLSQVTRGVVMVAARRESLAEQAWRFAWAMALGESGF